MDTQQNPSPLRRLWKSRPIRYTVKLLPLALALISLAVILLVIQKSIKESDPDGKLTAGSILEWLKVDPNYQRPLSKTFIYIIAFVGAFMLKSCVNFPPQIVLFGVAGNLFSLPVAIPVSIVGLLASLIIPYVYGMFWAPELDSSKNRAVLKVKRVISTENPAVFGFLVRIVPFIPGDAASMVAGSTRINYIGYSIGVVAGTMPTLICYTVAARFASTGEGKGVAYVSIGISTLISIVALVWKFWDIRKKRKLRLAAESNVVPDEDECNDE